MPARLFVSHPSCHCPTIHLLHQTKLRFFFFFSFPFFCFNLNHCRTMAHPSHTCRPLCCPHPSCLMVPMHQSPMLFTHTLHAHSLLPPLPPGSTIRWGFFFSFYIFNSNHCSTMAATTLPSPPCTHRHPHLLAPTPPSRHASPCCH